MYNKIGDHDVKNSSQNSLLSLVQKKQGLNPFYTTVASTITAFVNISITYPLYKLMFRQMYEDISFTQAYHQLKREGVIFLYRGSLPPLCQKAVSLSIMFVGYREVRSSLDKAGVPLFLANGTAAFVAGSVEALVLTPFERVQTVLQDRHHHKTFRNMPHTMKVLAVEHGFKEYYRGLVPIVWRNTITNAMYFYLLEKANQRLPKSEAWGGEFMKAFLTGSFIGALGSTAIYPLNLVKVHMQSSVGGSFQGWYPVLVQLYNERGFRHLYRGVHLNYTRSFLSWGIITALNDFFLDILRDVDKDSDNLLVY